MAESQETYTAQDYLGTADFIACTGAVATIAGGAEVALSIHFIDTGWAEALAAAPGVVLGIGGLATLGYGIFHIFRADAMQAYGNNPPK